jgi:hypothetical protein
MNGQGYDFGVTDYGSGLLNTPIVFRYWVGGVIKGIVVKTDSCDTAGGEVFWEPGYVGWGYGSTFTAWDNCGTYGAIVPYAADGSGLSTTSQHP